MDGRRTLLAISLSILILVGFQWLHSVLYPPPPKKPGPETDKKPEAGAPADPGGAGEPVKPEAEPPAPPAAGTPGGGAPVAGGPAAPAPAPAAPSPVAGPPAASPAAPAVPRTIPFETAVYRGELASTGAVIARLELAGWKEDDRKTPLGLLRPFGDETRPALRLRQHPKGPAFAVDPANLVWEAQELEGGGALFRAQLAPKLAVEKEIRPAPEGRHHFDVAIRLRNETGADLELAYELVAVDGMSPEDRASEDPDSHAVYGVFDDERVTVGLKTEVADDIEDDEPIEKANTAYGGVANRYFTIVLAPRESDKDQPVYFAERLDPPGHKKDEGPPPSVRAGYRRTFKVLKGGTAEHRYTLFAGPKKDDILASYEPPKAAQLKNPEIKGLARLLDLGFMESLSKVFLWILTTLQGLTNSYGIAIILLTIIVRAALHPLSVKSQRSMYKMQKLKPKMDAIREKYKGKRSKEALQRMNLETMELYREHGVSPLGGCLPMFLQLPVFIGLYNALAYSIELRQTPFLYIDDLSRPDRLFHLGLELPLIGHYFDWFNLLPLLMIVVMVVQQKLQPKPPDPQQEAQQKMMTYMFVVFGFLFYNVPAGLVLYFLTSSIIGIGEQKWVKHRIEQSEGGGAAPAAATAAS